MQRERPNIKESPYRSWKLHCAVGTLSMALAAAIVIIRVVKIGFSWPELLLIPAAPFMVYVTSIVLFISVITTPIGLVGFFGWHALRHMYEEINDFLKRSRTRTVVCWSEYFKIAFYVLVFWTLTFGVALTIFWGIDMWIQVGRAFFRP